MTLVLLAASALIAASGTHLAIAGFVAAACVGAATGGTMAPAAAWTAAMAAGLVLLGVPPRRLAVPVLGAAAALAAGSAGNAATVLTAWIVGTGAAVVLRADESGGRGWAFGLLLSDVLVGGAVAHTVVAGGLARWPGGIDSVGAALLLAAALARVPLAAGTPGAREAGLLIVRAQIVVLATMGLGAATRDVLLAAAVAGAGSFAAGGLASDDALRDGAQEAGLVVLALAAAGLGWRPGGWVWGALAGGTLIHYLRLSDRGVEPLNVQARAQLSGGGIGLPFLPAVTALGSAAVAQRDWVAGPVVAALAAGLASRARFGSLPERARRHRTSRVHWWPRARTGAVLALASAAALWAPLLALPRPPGAEPSPWPPVWAVLVVAAAGAGGLWVPGLAPAREPRRPPRPGGIRFLAGKDVPPAALAVTLGALVLGAAGLWIVGWLRGFL